MVRRSTRRLIRGTAVLLLVGGTAAVYKLSRNDVEAIERQTGRSADDLTEEELVATMKQLSINRLELSSEDRMAAERTDQD